MSHFVSTPMKCVQMNVQLTFHAHYRVSIHARYHVSIHARGRQPHSISQRYWLVYEVQLVHKGGWDNHICWEKIDYISPKTILPYAGRADKERHAQHLDNPLCEMKTRTQPSLCNYNEPFSSQSINNIIKRSIITKSSTEIHIWSNLLKQEATVWLEHPRQIWQIRYISL